jgi:cohesin complex subunit SCC1
MDAFTPGSGRRLGAARAASDALGSEPPTPAGAPSGHVDWSAATKRMLADVAPVLENGGATTVSEMTSRRDENNAKVKVSRSEAARIFYQVLVLKTHGFVDLEQKRAYGDIDVVAGPKMVEAA